VQALIGHGSGLATFWGADWLARRLAWVPPGAEQESTHLLQAAIGYLQARVGGGLAQRFSGGLFSKTVAELRVRLEAGQTPTPPATGPSLAPGRGGPADPEPGVARDIAELKRQTQAFIQDYLKLRDRMVEHIERQNGIHQEELLRAHNMVGIAELEAMDLRKRLEMNEADLFAEKQARAALRVRNEELRRRLKGSEENTESAASQLEAQDWSNEYEQAVKGKAGLRDLPEPAPTLMERKK
jgi:hypothetical protein